VIVIFIFAKQCASCFYGSGMATAVYKIKAPKLKSLY